MVDLVPALSATVPLASQIAGEGGSGANLSGVFLVIVILVAGILLFRQFLMPTATSMISAVKQIFTTPAGRVIGVTGVVLLGFLLLGGSF
jgi:hypothetical protein